MADNNTTIADLKQLFTRFVQERDWDKFHTPKNLAMNLGIEVAELQELLVWFDGDGLNNRVESQKQAIEDEVADIAFNLLQFCSLCKIDLATAIQNKLPKLDKKYPVDICKGTNDLYVEDGNVKKA